METDLKNALQAAIQEIISLSGITLHHVLNYTVGEKPNDNYLEFDILRTEPEQITVCGGARYQWIAQITIAVRDGVGVNAVNEFIDLVREKLFSTRQINSGNHTFKVSKPANVAPPLVGGGWYKVPISIRLMTVT